MKVNIYYGGRGLIEDSTLYTINRFAQVLDELRVNVDKYNLYEQKNGISMLPKTFKDADAIVLAVNVEWLGIGGYMAQFLDACWLYGDKEKMKKLYMMPFVIADTVGEKEAELTLTKAWEILGGTPVPGITAYVEDHTEFETNQVYASIIEARAEELYRIIKQKKTFLPGSTGALTKGIKPTKPIELTPQESEQLSVYVSDDTFVKKQKEDIGELSALYKEMMSKGGDDSKTEFFKSLRAAFKPIDKEFAAVYAICITDTDRTLVLDISMGTLKLSYGDVEKPDMLIKAKKDLVQKLTTGRITLQGAFMAGNITTKGDFKLIRSFDQQFSF